MASMAKPEVIAKTRKNTVPRCAFERKCSGCEERRLRAQEESSFSFESTLRRSRESLCSSLIVPSTSSSAVKTKLSRQNTDPNIYLTPTQRSNLKIKQLRSELIRVKKDLESKTKEVSELRRVVATSGVEVADDEEESLDGVNEITDGRRWSTGLPEVIPEKDDFELAERILAYEEDIYNDMAKANRSLTRELSDTKRQLAMLNGRDKNDESGDALTDSGIRISAEGSTDLVKCESCGNAKQRQLKDIGIQTVKTEDPKPNLRYEICYSQTQAKEPPKVERSDSCDQTEAVVGDSCASQTDSCAVQSDTIASQTDSCVVRIDTCASQTDVFTVSSDTSASQTDNCAVRSDTIASQTDSFAVPNDSNSSQTDRHEEENSSSQTDLSSSTSVGVQSCSASQSDLGVQTDPPFCGLEIDSDKAMETRTESTQTPNDIAHNQDACIQTDMQSREAEAKCDTPIQVSYPPVTDKDEMKEIDLADYVRKNGEPEQDPHIQMAFLKNAIFYYMTDRDHKVYHSKVIQSILNFSDKERELMKHAK